MAAGNGQKGGERASSIEQMRREHLINRRNVEQAACGKENAVSNALDQSHNEQSITFYADLGPEVSYDRQILRVTCANSWTNCV